MNFTGQAGSCFVIIKEKCHLLPFCDSGSAIYFFVSQNPSDAYRRSASLLRDITFNSMLAAPQPDANS